MAKTDSFGRPYYETAEEYNQAHRQAKASGTYGQMQQEKKAYSHTVGQGTKKQYGKRNDSKVIATMGLGVGVMIMMAIVIMTSIADGGATPEQNWYEEEYVESDDNQFVQTGTDDVPLAEGFDTVTYEGNAYTIPMTYEEFVLLDVPLQMYPSSGEEIAAGDSETLDLEDEDGNYIGYIRIENETDEDMPRGKCMVKYISFSSDASITEDIADTPDVTFGNGLDMTCSYEELEAYMGTPTYSYTDDNDGNLYENYQWEYYGEDHSEYFSATFWNGMLSEISVMVDTY